MADTRAQIVVSAVDNTKATFGAVKGRLGEIAGDASGLASKFAAVSGAIGGLLGAAGLGALVKTTVDGIDAFNDLADVTGSSVENLSRLEDTAARTGASFDTVSAALLKFGQVLNAAKPGSETEKILESIGLNVAELRKQDPVEALESTARALAKYADDGNKARITQELFGRSVREVGPLLKDLAEQGLGVARVTTEQAQAAEAFNRQLAQLRKDATDAGRALVGELLPVLSRLVREFTAGKEAFGGFFGALANIGTSRTFDTATEGLQFYRRELQRLRDAEAEILAGNDGQRFDIFGRDRIARTREAGVEVQKFITYYEKLLGLTNVQGGRGSIVPGASTRPSAPDLPGAPSKSTKDKAKAETDAFNKFQDDLEQRIRDFTRNTIPESEAAARLKELNDQQERLAELTGQRAAQQQAKDVELLNEAFFSGAISAEQYDNGLKAVFNGLGEVDKASQKTKSLTEDLGLTFSSAFEDAIVKGGKLSDVLRGLEQDLLRLVTRKLVTEPLGNALSAALTSSFAGFFADGGVIRPGQWGIVGEAGPEVIQAGRSSVAVQPMARGMTVTQAFYISGPVDQRTALQIGAEAQRGLGRAQRNL